MNWKTAFCHLVNGEKVKRPFWCSALILRDGRIEFDLPKSFDLAGELPVFEFYESDVNAEDWELIHCFAHESVSRRQTAP